MISNLAAAMLMAVPAPGCGSYVVGSHQSTLPLKDAQRKVVEELRVRDRKLSEPLQVVRCGKLVVIVMHRGSPYQVDRWRVLFEQEFAFECRERLAGVPERETTARTLNAFDRIVCLPLFKQPQPTPNPIRR